MEKCLLCGAEFERVKSARMACGSCFGKVKDTQARYLTLEERLWGKCYRKGACWEFGFENENGRPNAIRADRRQVPPSHVALWLSGHARPSPLHVVEHAHGANAMCVNPEHLRWVEQPKPRGPMWAHLMTPEQLATYHERFSAKRAEYQRNWRRRVKTLGGTKSVRDARNVRDMERTRALLRESSGKGRTPLVPLGDRSPGAQIAAERAARVAVVPPVVDFAAKYTGMIGGVPSVSAPAPAPVTSKPQGVRAKAAAALLARAELEVATARATAPVLEDFSDDERRETAELIAQLEREASAARAAAPVVTTAPEPEPIPSDPLPAASVVKLGPGPGLLASLVGAKIAPVD
jgi:hypothetical protein